MNAIARLIREGTGSKVDCKRAASSRKIRFASTSQARKAGKWAIKKYSGVFKKLAA